MPTSPLRRSSTWTFLAAALVALPGAARAAGATAEVEGGLIWNGYNDVRIPGAGGTRFSLVDDLAAERGPVFRARLGLTLGERHALLATWAPVRLEARGRLPRDVLFAGERFDAGSPILARYRFDSYRLTYRYGLVRSGAFDLDLGATAFVRDAGVSVQGDRYAEKTNVGFVPLLSFRLAWRFARPVALVVDGDALAAPQGRAEDVLFALELPVRDGVAIRAGYRLIEGGADNDEVYNFALVHHAVVGLRVGL